MAYCLLFPKQMMSLQLRNVLYWSLPLWLKCFPHICLIFSSTEIGKIWEWGRELGYKEMQEVHEKQCSFVISVFSRSGTARRWVKSTTLNALTGQSVAGEQAQSGPFMVRNVNKNIAWDRVIKTDAWGIIPSQDSHWVSLMQGADCENIKIQRKV